MASTSTHLTPVLNDYLVEHFSTEDRFLRQLRHDADAAGIPPIAIAPEQTAFLQVVLQAMGARRVLEIGSLAGYSAITMARALPVDGSLVCLELEPSWCDFIRTKAHEAGLGSVISVIAGPAATSIPTLDPAMPFDAVFIDADKPSYVHYVDAVLPLLRDGGIIIGDNALAWGHVAEDRPNFEPENVAGIRRFNAYVSSHPALTATLVPLGDGMTIAVKRPS